MSEASDKEAATRFLGCVVMIGGVLFVVVFAVKAAWGLGGWIFS